MKRYPNLGVYIEEVVKEIVEETKMLTFRERLANLFAPASFGIVDDRGEMYFVLADRLTMTKSGRLLFWRRGAVCAAVAEDKWERVLKGISLDDMKATED